LRKSEQFTRLALAPARFSRVRLSSLLQRGQDGVMPDRTDLVGPIQHDLIGANLGFNEWDTPNTR
jgi:hypothetical protein